LRVKFRWSLPSAFMTKTSAPVPSRQLRKAIFRPSGDQAAHPSGTAFRGSRRSPLPSALITKISSLQAPARSHSPALPRGWIAKTSFRRTPSCVR
jgi:hypothetical protein